jgi:hypothetical protein
MSKKRRAKGAEYMVSYSELFTLSSKTVLKEKTNG